MPVNKGKVVKNTKNTTKNKCSAIDFFYREISPTLNDKKKSTKKKVNILANVDSAFRKQNDDFQQDNFWVLLDEELFIANERVFQKSIIASKNKKLRHPNQHALGLLTVVTGDAAFNKEIFQEVVKAYKNAYQVEETSLLTKALDYQNSNVLHIICQMLANRAEEISINKDHWAVYEYLVQDEHYKQLLEAFDKYDRRPSQFLEEANLVVGNEHLSFYAVPR